MKNTHPEEPDIYHLYAPVLLWEPTIFRVREDGIPVFAGNALVGGGRLAPRTYKLVGRLCRGSDRPACGAANAGKVGRKTGSLKGVQLFFP